MNHIHDTSILLRIKYIYLGTMTNIDEWWFISKLSGVDFISTSNEGMMLVCLFYYNHDEWTFRIFHEQRLLHDDCGLLSLVNFYILEDAKS